MSTYLPLHQAVSEYIIISRKSFLTVIQQDYSINKLTLILMKKSKESMIHMNPFMYTVYPIRYAYCFGLVCLVAIISLF